MEAAPDPWRWWVLLASCLLTLAVLTVPSMTLAWEPGTPRLFGANDLTFRLATTVPALLFAAIALIGGVLADLTGRRRVLLVGVALFLAGGLLTIAARTQLWLIVGRLTMAVGGGLCAPLAMALVRVGFPPEERARALGIFTAVQGIALVGGPMIAGQVNAAWDWRVAHALPLVAGLGGGLVAWWTVRDRPNRLPHAREDLVEIGSWWLILLAAIFVAGLLHIRAYSGSYLVVAVMVAALGAAGLVWHWRRDGHGTGRSRVVSIATTVISGVLLFAAFMAAFLQLNNFLGQAQQASSGARLLQLLPLAPAILMGGMVLSRRLGRLGPRGLSALAFALMAAGAAGLSLAGPQTAYLWMLLPLLLLGVGFSLGLLRMNTLVLGMLPTSLAGSAAALAATLGRIGANLGQVLGGEALLRVSSEDLVARLQAEGLGDAQVLAASDALARVVAQSSIGATAALPAAISDLLSRYVDAYATGFAAVMRAVAFACMLTAILVWAGLRQAATDVELAGDTSPLSAEGRSASRVSAGTSPGE